MYRIAFLQTKGKKYQHFSLFPKGVFDGSKGISDDSKDVSDISTDVSGGSKWFLLFPTKKHWKQKSKVKYIVDGLEWLVNNYKREGIGTIALPALGCRAGRLVNSWSYYV